MSRKIEVNQKRHLPGTMLTLIRVTVVLWVKALQIAGWQPPGGKRRVDSEEVSLQTEPVKRFSLVYTAIPMESLFVVPQSDY